MVESLMRMQTPATLQAIRDGRKRLDYVLKAAGATEQARGNLALAFAEIATNVVRHATPSATILSLRLLEGDRSWTLEVLDDGGGFTDLKNQMAALQWQVGDATLLESGMGLALIRALCCHHEYTIGEQSSDGLNCFCIGMAEENKGAHKPRIALLDDDRALSTLMAEYLSEKYRVDVFSEGKTAMASLQTQTMDLIISDIRMPGMDGFQFRECLAEHPELEMTPFIFLTGHEKVAWQSHAATMGIDDYLIKPVSKDVLLRTVGRILQRSRKLKALLGDRLNNRLTAVLRPSLPKNLGLFRLEIRTRNASAGGGDFVFHRTLPTGELLLLGDIMGHGEDAKFFAHAGYFLGLMEGVHAPDCPESALRFLSQATEKDSILAATLVTCLALTLNPDGSLTMACAGHPPPIILSPGGPVMVDVGGALPGLLPEVPYEQKRVVLGGQERLLLYTDGLFESAADNTGREDLRKTLLNAAGGMLGQPLVDAADVLAALFDKTAGLSPRDDATFILLERV